MATYYIDYDTGSDTNNGTSTSTPWQHCPGDANATDNANITLSAGDTVIFKGGVTYTGTGSDALISITQSGTSDNYITYRGNTTSGDWGTGKALIDCDYLYYHAFEATNIDYIEINNFSITKGKNVNNDQNVTMERDGVVTTGIDYNGNGLVASYGIIRLYNGCTYITIKDTNIYEMENYTDRSVLNAESDEDPNTPSSVPAMNYGIDIRTSCSNIDIDNCQFWATGRYMINVNSSSDVDIHDCNAGGETALSGDKNKYWSVFVAINGGSSNVNIYDNTVHGGWWYVGEDLNGPHSHATDTIHIWGSSSNIKIERNYFYNDRVFATARGTSQLVYAEDGSTYVYVRNNIGVNLFSNPCIYISSHTGMDYYWIENNTLVQWNIADSAVHLVGIGSNVGSHLYIKNNILIQHDSGGKCIRDLRSAWAGECDYNVYYAPNNTSGCFSLADGSGNRSFTDWQTATGQDSNSSFGDPNLTDEPASAANADDGDYSLSASSSNCIGQGVDLSSSFTDDFAGNTRGNGTGWDIGAYEYYLDAPTNLTCEGEASPSNVTDTTPEFTADVTVGPANVTKVYVQVSETTSFDGALMWDSGSLTLTAPLMVDGTTEEITYGQT